MVHTRLATHGNLYSMAEGVRTAVVVDDDPDIRRMLRVALEMAGLAVLEAGTGLEGLELVRLERPDLITLDLVLPDLGGVEVCRRLREVTDAYLIMITSSSDERDRLVGLATGADDYITKPFNPREVQARVAAMFRRPRVAAAASQSVASWDGTAARPAPELTGGGIGAVRVPDPRQRPDDASITRHGALSVDAEGRIAQWGMNELPLTKIEFELLATMMRHPRRAWTRELLLEEVWGSQWSDHHVVEVHIGNLRRKLAQAAPNREIIQTVRGVGYRLAPA